MADITEIDGNQQSAAEDPGALAPPRLAFDQAPADAAPPVNLELDGLPPPRPAPEAGVLAALEARVRRLEAELALIQDTKVIEDRVVERVSRRIRKTPATQIRTAAMKFVDGDQPAPAAAPAPEGIEEIVSSAPAPQDGMDGAPVAQAIVAPVAALALALAPAPVAVAALALAPVATVVAETPAVPPTLPAGKVAALRQLLSSGTAWLFLDALIELRCMWRMTVDPRYHMSFAAKLMPLVLLGLIATSWIWLPGIAIISGVSVAVATLLVKIVDLLLAYFLYKVLGREVHRYRETAPDLPAALRL